MMIRTFDVVALDADTEDAARLIGLLLDLRHAKNTLLLKVVLLLIMRM